MYAVIMAGGGGTRLWPLSRSARPKPFLPLLGERTLLQATVSRSSPLIEPRDVFVVTDARYASLVHEQVPELPLGNLLPEPMGRNTAAAVAYAAAAIDRADDEVMVVLPADQRILDEPGFRVALAAAARRADDGDLVTLGITPTRPETGYGYVLATGEPVVVGGSPTFRVERFLEKPTLDRAEALIASGRASWNGGIFVWRRDVVRDGLARHAPDIWEAVVTAARWCRAVAAGIPRFARRPTTCPPSLLGEGRVAVVPVSWAGATSGAGMRSRDARRPTRGGPRRRRGDASSSVAALARACRRRPPGSWWGFVTPSWSPHRTRCRCAADTPGVKLVVERLIAEGRTERL